jgi:hypothetical protein
MSSHSAVESLIQEFVSSPEFLTGLHDFREESDLSARDMLWILRQYVLSPQLEAVYSDFWSAPAVAAPDYQIDETT